MTNRSEKMNNVTLTGRLTADPQLNYTASGTAIATFTVAVRRRVQSEGQPDADFIRVVAWGKLGETVAQHMKKGRMVGVQGRIQTRSYENNEGRRVYVTEIVAETVEFLDRPSTHQNGDTSPFTHDLDDDDLPF